MVHIKSKIHITGGQFGFTLIELLITLAISGILMTSVYAAFQTQQDSYLAQEQVAEMQQNIRAGLDMMVYELRMAGYDMDKNGDKTGTAGITVANPNTVTFTLVADDDSDDSNNDGTVDEAGELKTIRYNLFDAYGDGSLDLVRLVGTVETTKRAVAENVDALEFNYLDSAGAVTAVLADIRSIQISILARAGNPDRKFNNGQIYTPASGVVWDLNGASAGNGNPPNDNFRRRFQIVTVKCRNMGL